MAVGGLLRDFVELKGYPIWQDWIALRQAALQDPELLDKVARVCQAHTDDPYAQRYYFWMNYVKEHRTLA